MTHTDLVNYSKWPHSQMKIHNLHIIQKLVWCSLALNMIHKDNHKLHACTSYIIEATLTNLSSPLSALNAATHTYINEHTVQPQDIYFSNVRIGHRL